MLFVNIFPIFASVKGIEAGWLLFFIMDRIEFEKTLKSAAEVRGCVVKGIDFDDDNNVFDVVIARTDLEPVSLEDCESIHRAVLSRFDRNVEDYALTIGSEGMDAGEADEILKTINE